MRFSTGAYVLTENEIIGFASQYDPQPFHTDPDAARDTLFGGLAASGWQTAAVTMKLLVQYGVQLAGGIVGAGCELSWPAPTRPGDSLHVEGEVIEVLPAPAGRRRGTIRLRSETKNQDGAVVQIMVAKLVVQRLDSSGGTP
ncbi:MAG: MaoC family dehydratase [Massilia sp.]